MRALRPEDRLRPRVRKLSDDGPAGEPVVNEPAPTPFAASLDAWDVLLVLSGIALGAFGFVRISDGDAGWPGLAVMAGGLVVGISALAVRRHFDPRSRQRDEVALVKPPSPRSSLAIAGMAVGGFLMLLSAVALGFIALVVGSAGSGPKPGPGDWAPLAAIAAGPGAVGLALFVFARRGGRRRDD